MKTESVDPEDEGDEGLPSDNFIVGRVKRNLLQNSFIGAIFTSRDSTVEGDYNRVFGVDAVFQFFNRLNVSGYVLGSQTPGVDNDQDAQKLSVGWRDNALSFGANYEKVGDNFNPEVGFVRRRDMSHYSGEFFLPAAPGGQRPDPQPDLPDQLRFLRRYHRGDRDPGLWFKFGRQLHQRLDVELQRRRNV